MPMMSLALANSISTSRCIETHGYNLRRHVVTPVPQKKRENYQGFFQNKCLKLINYIKTF